MRVAFTQLLLCVKRIRSIHFSELAGPDELLRRLELDAEYSPVASGITELLRNSYFPYQESASVVRASCPLSALTRR